MSVLSACQEAAIELSQGEPATLFSTSDTFAKELRLQANKAAVAIAKAHDWQAITVLNTITGTGVATAFSLPVDYDRMPKKAMLRTSLSEWPISASRDLDQWLYDQTSGFRGPSRRWIILGGKMQILPALASGATAKFYYISKSIVSGNKTAFTADADTFRLPERLLTLGVVWRWRAAKRMEYAEDLRNFEIALSEEIGTDKGSRPITIGDVRLSIDADYAHPPIMV